MHGRDFIPLTPPEMEIIGEGISLGRRTTEDGEEKKERLIGEEEREGRRPR